MSVGVKENSRLSTTHINSEINLLKFVFAVIILLRHFLGEYSGVYKENSFFGMLNARGSFYGVIGVTFFFCVTGFYLVNNFDGSDTMNCAEYAFNYTRKKYKKIFVPLVVSLLMPFLANAISAYRDMSFDKATTAVLKMIPSLFVETTGTAYFGFPCAMLNSPAWYLSTLFISVFPLAMIMKKNRNFFIYFLAPFGGLAILGLSYHYADGNLALGEKFFRLFRGYWGILLGVCAYLISKKIIRYIYIYIYQKRLSQVLRQRAG